MKEAVGESAMTLITIALVAAAVGAAVIIISNLLTGQRNRANCENSGYTWTNGKCMNNTKQCYWNDSLDEYICN